MTRSANIGAQMGSQDWRERAIGSARVVLPGPGYYVYVAWGTGHNRPLYVGKTRNFHRRMAGHERDSGWWQQVRRFMVYAYESEEAAIVAEAEAIQALRPQFNQVGNKGHQVALARYLRPRVVKPQVDYGPSVSSDEIPADQLAIIRRVQNRGAA